MSSLIFIDSLGGYGGTELCEVSAPVPQGVVVTRLRVWSKLCLGHCVVF